MKHCLVDSELKFEPSDFIQNLNAYTPLYAKAITPQVYSVYSSGITSDAWMNSSVSISYCPDCFGVLEFNRFELHSITKLRFPFGVHNINLPVMFFNCRCHQMLERQITEVSFLCLAEDEFWTKEGDENFSFFSPNSVGGTVACESTLRSAGTLLSRVRAPPSAPRPDGGP
ncbi:hypothetical protein PoB_000297900 [Plakobranchus ocellatus]|uniref:Programmed cell death protein 2 C-terminal domain-containing protein n=1 Tax=Plakobranchus ocellatus TaxID=259542 RepID=A0AAV3Y2L2_9GAST|nr:hypothetical protein PoB_000297900 [Plakobranchus ocellatus]